MPFHLHFTLYMGVYVRSVTRAHILILFMQGFRSVKMQSEVISKLSFSA
jgi:hypothetical protein